MATRQKEKALARAENRDRRPRASAKYIRISSSKVKVVIDLIRGKTIDEARAILTFTPKAAAPVVLKLLDSAVANAENNLEMDPATLYVAEVFADMGPTLKRIRPRAMGRAARINKRTSHITVVLDERKA